MCVLHHRENWDMSIYIIYRSAGPEGRRRKALNTCTLSLQSHIGFKWSIRCVCVITHGRWTDVHMGSSVNVSFMSKCLFVDWYRSVSICTCAQFLLCVHVFVQEYYMYKCVWVWVCARGRVLSCFYPGVCFWPEGSQCRCLRLIVCCCDWLAVCNTSLSTDLCLAEHQL